MTRESTLERFHRQIPVRFEPARDGIELNATLIDVDAGTGKARAIHRIQRR